ncbi:FAD-dependent oxidoreductase [Nitrosovibrio sp. Nv6]|uniref:FAD-dependent oxidoreductase n=1 Tax=Nitrosovibrio sp. Nv6 TaxID=1855340 RepID=UPI0008C3FBD0|nr:FAD-dependent oxidoreductase [Nitrosovibrio sp. Nv6]SEP39413.1 NAD(P)-binding Rossmann-like domain-containing protein [Nitrosovibrio sp. Nv6]
MPDNETHKHESEIYDVVIVGGGIAGLYCCHELIKKHELLKINSILLLEASNRFGGRIETWSLLRADEKHGEAIGFQDTWDPCNWDFASGKPDPLAPQGDKQSPYRGPTEKQSVEEDGNVVEKLSKIEYFRAEFGPMRIEPRDQPLLQGLLDELGIKEPVPGEEESLDDLVPFSSYASEDPMEPRFTLREEEAQQKTPFDLMILALRRIFEIVEGIEPEDKNSKAVEESGTSAGNVPDPKLSGPWRTDAANKQWENLHRRAFFYRHYWKGQLLEWIQNLTEADFKKIRERAHFRGHPLWDLGFWNVLSDVLSHFAVIKIRDWGSYYHFVHENLNAAEWIIFWLKAIRSTGSLRGIRGGMSRIIWKLLERLHKERKNNPGLCIQKGRKALGLQSNGGEIDVIVENEENVVKARRVILALPKQPLEEMSWNGRPPQGTLKESLNAVACLPLLKCFFVIERPWWEDNRPLNRSAADIPTRELLYVKSSDGTKGLIMVYTDRPAITFWSDYLRTRDSNQAQPDQEPSEAPQLESQEIARTWFLKLEKESFQSDAPRESYFNEENTLVVKEPGYPRLWQRFVQFARDYEHHDFTEDRLLACGMRDWGKKPFGAAAHGWLPGVMSWKHIEFLEAFSLTQDVDGIKNIHVCGEAFSDYQGFIEGSLRSARRVLRIIEKQAKSAGGKES